ncbi:late blight resistance protein R1-A-like [Ipomoea triloba]|uniref:late blight resistance protein R1-A-like n=1 Tax=Ipomoea triloba TaxID=35885 RepID=UPI00125D4B09|nr:late blight resistance protein R1-A-like [Ipomoea triloba]
MASFALISLRKHLKEQRYLIVMDDIWSSTAWDSVQRCFPDDNNGSRILLTSRLKEVAEYASSDIVKKCNGLPLAITVIASLLSKIEAAVDKWNNVTENVSRYVIGDSNDACSKILYLSYNQLPHHLKACFLYFGVFQEDYEMPVKKLVRLWAAEGFLRTEENRNMEEVAMECLQDLVDRSLIFVSKQSYNEKMKTIRIHDLLRDLCLREVRHENLLNVIEDEKFPFYKLEELIIKHWGYHIHIPCCDIPWATGFLPNLKKLKFSWTNLSWSDMTVIGILPNLEVLKLIHAIHSKDNMWEPSKEGFRQLKRLVIEDRYLERWNVVGDNFSVLECLELRNCYSLQEIPSGFADITTLALIKLNRCLDSVLASPKLIQEEQYNYYGNALLVCSENIMAVAADSTLGCFCINPYGIYDMH